MIHYITGKLTFKNNEFVVIETHGVGYQIFVSDRILKTLPEINSNLKLYCYNHIREDCQNLFGFLTTEDLMGYELIISVSGVGPKLGIKILSHLDLDQITNEILTNSTSLLLEVPGVGKKVAQRIVLELKDKISKLNITPASVSQEMNPDFISPETQNDYITALKTLGYSVEETKQAIKKSKAYLTESMPLEEGLKVLLKSL